MQAEKKLYSQTCVKLIRGRHTTDIGNLKMELSVLKEIRRGTDPLKNLHLKKINKEILFYSHCEILTL